jgi:hypothetical protein
MEIGGKACESHILSVPYRRIVPVTPLQIAVTRGHLNMCGLLKLKLPSILHMSRNSPEQPLSQLHKLLQSALVFVYAKLSNLHTVCICQIVPWKSCSNPNINNGLGVCGQREPV